MKDVIIKITKSEIIIVFALLLTSFMIHRTSISFANEVGVAIVKPLDEITKLLSNIDSSSCAVVDALQLKKIENVNEIIVKQKEHHKTIFLMLYKNNYALVICLSIFSIISAIFALWIAQTGWRDVPNKVKVVFLTAAAISSYFGLQTKIFNHQAVIAQNMHSYEKFDDLQNDILAFCSISCDDRKKCFELFYKELIDNVKKYNGINLEINQNVIAPKDYLASPPSGM